MPPKDEDAENRTNTSQTQELLGQQIGLPDKLSQQISRLQTDLANERDKRREERFVWIAISSFMTICFISISVPTAALAVILPLYLIFLIVAADRCGVDDVKYAVSNLLQWVLKRFDKD